MGVQVGLIFIGLEKAEVIIVEDLETFNQHLIHNKKESNRLTKAADKMANDKQKAMKLLKRKKDLKANEISNNTKKLEVLEEYYKYKIFLDNLAEREWKEQLDTEHSQYRQTHFQNLYSNFLGTHKLEIKLWNQQTI